MAKQGNRSQGPKTVAQGPCTDCGKTSPEDVEVKTKKDGKEVVTIESMPVIFTPVRRYTASGKGRMIRLCSACLPKV